jgi:ATP-dependent Clp protease ATP-binding subunit ClpC
MIQGTHETKSMFHLFTEKAIKTIMLAQEESRSSGHNYVAPEQLLLGIMGAGDSVSFNALKSMGVSLSLVRAEVTRLVPNGSDAVVVEIPFSEGAKRALELSWDEARKLGHDYIGTEHLLLGLLRDKDTVATKALENVGAEITRLQRRVLAQITETAQPPMESGKEEK